MAAANNVARKARIVGVDSQLQSQTVPWSPSKRKSSSPALRHALSRHASHGRDLPQHPHHPQIPAVVRDERVSGCREGAVNIAMMPQRRARLGKITAFSPISLGRGDM